MSANIVIRSGKQWFRMLKRDRLKVVDVYLGKNMDSVKTNFIRLGIIWCRGVQITKIKDIKIMEVEVSQFVKNG